VHPIHLVIASPPRLWGTLGCHVSVNRAPECRMHAAYGIGQSRKPEYHQCAVCIQNRLHRPEWRTGMDSRESVRLQPDIGSMVQIICSGGGPDGHCNPELLCGLYLPMDPAYFGTSGEVDVWVQRFGLQPILLADTKDTTVGKSTTKPTKSRHALAAF
jgi:hypothetical protein